MTTQDLLITRISDQIREEQDYTRILEKGGLRLSRTKYWVPVPVLLFLIWAVVCNAVDRREFFHLHVLLLPHDDPVSWI